MGFSLVLRVVVLFQVFFLNIYGQQLPVFRDDYTYAEQTHSFYKFHTTRSSWQKAVNTCATEGATFFYPVNKCEADIVLEHWSQTPAYGWAFVGVSSLNKGVFETIDGRVIWDVYSNWRPGEPNNENGKEECVVLLHDGTLNDIECNKTFPFICKKKVESSNGEAICDRVEKTGLSVSFRKDYRYLENTKSFYKIHTTYHNWQDAKEICNKEEATLFYPNNKCEASAVLEFWNSTEPFEKVYVGISSLAEGSFQTVHGLPVWKVYDNWHAGEPNNENSNEECVVLHRDGMLNDIGCGTNLPFICRKTVDSNKEVAVCDKPETDLIYSPHSYIRKDYKYFEDTQSLYKIHTIFQNWQNAKVTCESEGATLFYPKNKCEANTVLTFWNETQPFDQVHIGVYNPTKEVTLPQFRTIDDRPVFEVYNDWYRGEPNNINGEENCVLLLRSEGTLMDDRCDKKKAFICKISVSKGDAFCESTENSKKFRKDYTYLDETQSFYKMHKNFQSWQQAKVTCEKEGAFLYYPENTCEVNIVLKFWNQILPSRRIYVGISSQSRGVFETVRGVPAWKVYSKWQPGEPNFAYEMENCVIFHQDSLVLSDEKCDKKLPFICKKTLQPRKSGHGCDIPDASANSFRNDYIYSEDTQSLYKFHTIFDDFRGANKTCTTEGASLFYPENDCELNVVMQYWNGLPIITPVRVLDTAHIRNQEPDSTNSCEVLLRFNGIGNYTRRSCNEVFMFICKKVIDTENRDAFCDNPKTGLQVGGGFQSDYIYLNDTQSFYKFHKKAHTWQDAKNICAREGASLFYPTNKCEAKAVLEFWSQPQSFGWIFIGISSSVKGTFETIDYKSVWDVYNDWRPGEPNNANGDEKCVVLLHDGTLNDVNCLNSYSFICKKEINPRNGQALCNQAKTDEKPGMTFRKDYKYLSDTQSFYKIHTIKNNWQEAKQICVKEDAILFYPENKCEANVVLEHWNQTQPFSSIYVGISSLTKGLFETVSGRPVWDVYNKWRPGEPNNENGNENCVAFMRDGTFIDVQCSINFPFICRKKNISQMEIAVCDRHEKDEEPDFSYRKDYNYIKKTRSFYKIHTILRNWPDAKKVCIEERAKLFYADNELEANTVLDFWKQTQPFEKVYVGVSNPTKDTLAAVSHFVTIDGRPVNETYNKWHPGEPNNLNGEEYCVVLSRDGTLSDERCGMNFAFICKRTVDSVLETAIHGKPETKKEEVAFRKDYTYFEETQSYYKFHTEFSSWNTAKQTCNNEGATLFYPRNKCEAGVVLAFWKRTQIVRRVFIGVSSPETGTFETIDGSPIWLVYNNWLPGEPNNAGNIESCVVLYRNGTLNDEQCESKIPFICRKKIYSDKQSSCSTLEFNETRLIQRDYTYLEDTQSLYKIHTILRSWSEAKKTCNREGASLFYAENECEVQAVIRFWEKTQAYDWMFLGLTSPIKGKYETVDGRPIWDVYYKWRSNQPDNAENMEDCVVIYREDATFNDDKCVNKAPFICKKRTNFGIGPAFCDKPKKYSKEVNDYIKDYTFLDDVQSLYKIHTIFQNWHSANEICIEEGAFLFYPENELEFRSLQTFWKETQVYNELLIGLLSKRNETFEKFDGQSVKGLYNKWAPGKPTIMNGCVLLRRDGTLDEDFCTTTHPFICKKRLNLLKWNIFCNTEDFDYRYSKALGKCYKFHLTPMNWTEAYAACSKEHSYLAVINSQDEANFLVKVTDQAAKENVPGNFLAGAVHLGFQKQNGTLWRTITDQSLQEAGYDRWSYSQPDGGDREDCGSMFYNGELNDLGCFHKCFFICEHDIVNSRVP